MTQLNNLKHLKPIRKRLRNEPTSAEELLWNKLRNSQLDGRKFRRQHSIGNYILDFYCPKQKLAIELDGDSHFTPEAMECDEKRTEFLNSLGIRVLRFTNTEVFENLENVLEEIRKPHPNPLLGKEGELENVLEEIRKPPPNPLLPYILQNEPVKRRVRRAHPHHFTVGKRVCGAYSITLMSGRKWCAQRTLLILSN